MRAITARLFGAATLLVLLAANSLAQTADEPPLQIGDRLERSRSLRDVRGNRRALSDFQDYRAIVLFFAGTECPLANLYLPRIIEIEADYRPQIVKFIAIYSNENESLPEIAAHGGDRDIPFLLTKDVRQQLADRLGIERTPAVVILDGDRRLRYRGRIDDQYSVASRRPERTSDDLVQGLEQVLAGAEVAVPETEYDGCLIDRTRLDTGLGSVTYARDVAPILQRRCQTCHRPGQIGPFSLLSYEDAARRSAMIGEVVEQRRMPPWHADERYGEFANDRRLTSREVDVVRAWVEQGAALGDVEDLPADPDWSVGFHMRDPDVVLSHPEPVEVPATGVMDYMYQTSTLDVDEDVWVQEAEILPGDPSVLHHVLIYIQPPGASRRFDRTTNALVNWVPGTVTKVNPPGTATRIPKGSTLLWELHYTPNGKATTDQTSAALRLAKAPPERETRFSIFANFWIQVEPDSPHHVERDEMRFQGAVRLLSFRPHMHVRGKSWKYEAIYPGGRTETLLNVPNWDFNWQTEYFFEEPIQLPAGTVIRSTTLWDNSDNNLLNPDSSASVRYGLQTFEEMMNGWVKYVPEDMAEPQTPPSQSTAANRSRQVSRYARMVFRSVDTDRDGKISTGEWQANNRIRPWFESKKVDLTLPIELEGFIAAFPTDQ